MTLSYFDWIFLRHQRFKHAKACTFGRPPFLLFLFPCDAPSGSWQFKSLSYTRQDDIKSTSCVKRLARLHLLVRHSQKHCMRLTNYAILNFYRLRGLKECRMVYEFTSNFNADKLSPLTCNQTISLRFFDYKIGTGEESVSVPTERSVLQSSFIKLSVCQITKLHNF